MNENPTIVIQPVANGFVVTLPFKYASQWEGLKEIVQPKDKMLEPDTKDNVYIFKTFLEVLGFLSDKYSEK